MSGLGSYLARDRCQTRLHMKDLHQVDCLWLDSRHHRTLFLRAMVWLHREIRVQGVGTRVSQMDSAVTEISSPGSSASDVSTSTLTVSLRCPATRLQQGINKPKIYTHKTVRWCMWAATTEGPDTLDEACQDPKWVTAMDN